MHLLHEDAAARDVCLLGVRDFFSIAENAGNSQCVDHGDEMSPQNLDGVCVCVCV